MKFRHILSYLFQKKTYSSVEVNKTSLSRCLHFRDLVALGIGTTLGAGVYVVAGQVAKNTAGPAVIISFFIAAIASVMAGLCYAEFGARVPRTGSAYIYSYVAVGELMAFIIGWNMILEYIIGAASVARAWSENFDIITGGHIGKFFNATTHMNLPWLAQYPDFFAFFITILLTVILSVGVKESSTVNNIFTVLNMGVILYVIITGLWNANIGNWKIHPRIINDTEGHNKYDPTIGYGYFAPFGVSGIISGAATCFYAFVGFDAISTTSEEVLNPQKAIPFSIIICLLVCFLAYASVSAVITLMFPYYLIDPNIPLPFIYEQIGWKISKYIVGVGALFGLSTSLLGGILPLPRIIYAMASDGLLFEFLSIINQRFKTPLIATILSGLLAAIMAAIFDLKTLVDMMSIGTLLAYTLVAFSILLLRCSKESIEIDDDVIQVEKIEINETKINFADYKKNILMRRTTTPSIISDFISKVHSYIIFLLIFILDILLVQNSPFQSPAILFFIVFFGLIIIFLCVTLHIQPENQQKVAFKVRGVPWIPVLSMMVNVYLMMKLSTETWYRFGVWMFLGFSIYFFYSLCHSKERLKRSKSDEQILISK